MKKHLLKFCIFSILFSSPYLRSMDKLSAGTFVFTPPKQVGFLKSNHYNSNGRFIFHLVDAESIIREQKKYTEECYLNGYELNKFNHSSSKNVARLIYSLEISTPRRIFYPPLQRFIVVIKITQDHENQLSISNEISCFRYAYCREILFSKDFEKGEMHLCNTEFFGRTIDNIDKSEYKSDPTKLITDFLSEWLCIFISIFSLQDGRRFDYDFNRNIREMFLTDGQLIPILILRCGHCFDLCELACKFDKTSNSSIEDKISNALKYYSTNSVLCPTCMRFSPNPISIWKKPLPRFSPEFMDIWRHKLRVPLALEYRLH